MTIRQQIENDIGKFIRLGLSKGVFVNPRIGSGFFSNANQISSKHSFFNDFEDFVAKREEYYSNNCFVVEMKDGEGYFQLHYEFEHKRKKSIIKKLSLCFVPTMEGAYVKNEYIRVDYSSDGNSFFHSDAHMHIGFTGEVRIPVKELYLFSDFCMFVFYLYFQEHFISMSLRDDHKKHTLDISTTGLTKHEMLSKEVERNFFLHIRTSLRE